MDTFTFCPDYMVVKTKPPQSDVKGVSFQGWSFSSKPKVPYQKSFTATLQGMRWYLLANGLYDEASDTHYNARLLEKFYEAHGMWDPFNFPHPHFGTLVCRFSQPVEVPEGIVNSGGWIDKFDILLVHSDPGY